jgi:hypothetical protein
MNKSPLAAPHHTSARVVHQQQDDTLEEECATMPSTRVRDIRLCSGHTVCNVPISYAVIVSNDLSRFQKERAIVNALKKEMSFKQNQPTNHTRHLLGAFRRRIPDLSKDIWDERATEDSCWLTIRLPIGSSAVRRRRRPRGSQRHYLPFHSSIVKQSNG